MVDAKIVVIGIGNPDYSYDSFGPVLASLAKQKLGYDVLVLGSVDDPIYTEEQYHSAVALLDIYKPDYIIALDAAKCSEGSQFNKIFKTKNVKPGFGVGKKLKPIGNVALKLGSEFNGERVSNLQVMISSFKAVTAIEKLIKDFRQQEA